MTADILRLRRGDGHLLLNVAEDVFDDELMPARIEHFLNDESHILIVACRDGRVIGQLTAMLHRHPDSPGDIYVDNLGVAPQYRRQGIATKLVERMLDTARELGCRDVWLATDIDNEAAAALYRRTGAVGRTVTMFSYDLED